MLLSRFDISQSSSMGSWMHVVHPIYGHKLYTGRGASPEGELLDSGDTSLEGGSSGPLEAFPVRILVRGYSSPEVKAFTSKLAGVSKSKSLEDFEVQGHKLLDLLVISWEGVTDEDGNPLPCTFQNKVRELTSNRHLENQVLNFAKDQENFYRGFEQS